MRIQVHREVLTDKSEAFNVTLYESAAGILVLPAISERAAHELADSLAQLITLHTTEHVWH